MTVLSIAGFALGLNTMSDRGGGGALLTKVFWLLAHWLKRGQKQYNTMERWIDIVPIVPPLDGPMFILIECE
jgi:hypothetical protein